MWESLLELFRIASSIAEKLWAKIRPHAAVVAITMSTVMLVAMFLFFLQGRPPQQVKLLTGPHGGGSERLGSKLAERLEQPEVWKLHKRPVQLVVEPSQGYEDNRQQIDRDRTGNYIGFGHDGFGAPGNVKILLPLNESYVHIMVSQELYEAATDGKITSAERTFDHIASFLKDPVVYSEDAPDEVEKSFRYTAFLGPELSGTHQTATMILKHYGVPITTIDSEANFDWQHMKFSMFGGQIHLAFFTTSLGNRTIEQIAQRGGFYLLGLNGVDGIRTRNPHISKAEIPQFSYGINGDEYSAFCSTDLETIATRQVIMCSNSMSEKQGYYLASQLKEAVREEVSSISWGREAPDPSQPVGFAFPLHTGTAPISGGYKPWYARIPGPTWPTVFIVFTSIAGSILRKWNASLEEESEQTPGNAPAGATSSDDPPPVGTLELELAAMVTEISAESDLDRSAYRRWQNRTREVRRKIAQQAPAKEDDNSRREILLRGLGELECELELRNPSSAAEKQTAAPGDPASTSAPT